MTANDPLADSWSSKTQAAITQRGTETGKDGRRRRRKAEEEREKRTGSEKKTGVDSLDLLSRGDSCVCRSADKGKFCV